MLSLKEKKLTWKWTNLSSCVASLDVIELFHCELSVNFNLEKTRGSCNFALQILRAGADRDARDKSGMAPLLLAQQADGHLKEKLLEILNG